MITSSDILHGKVLIVDDQRANILLLERTLSSASYLSIMSTTKPDEVCGLQREHDFDLILLDIEMPGMDGFQVMAGLREVVKADSLSVLAVTANPAYKVRALQGGAKDFVSKPFDLAEVLIRVHNMLEVRLLHEESRINAKALEAQVSDRTAQLVEANGKLRREIQENADLQTRFIQSQKMEVVGRLAGGIAHDFNNLLTAIGGYSYFLLASLAPDDARRGDVEQIKKAGERASALTRQLLAFSRRQIFQPVVVDCNALVVDLEKMLARIIGEDVELLVVLAPGTGRIKADPGQVEQTLLNLVVNAKDAMLKGGKVTMETSNVVLTEGSARMQLPAKPGPYVMFTIGDTGSGMDASTMSHLFEPFFTTKEQGKGTGLGLATVYGIVQQSGGGIRVDSEVGRGTRFEVYFPLVEETARPAASAQAPAPPPRGSETILVVDDDELVRGLIHRVLVESGYTVLMAEDPARAIRLCESHAAPIHLILSDMIMPQMHGPELIERLAPLHPEAKVIYMSGYTETSADRRGFIGSGVPLLQKPMTPDVLARRVREVLAGVPC